MQNRHERRAAKKLPIVLIDIGTLPAGNQNNGLPVGCYVCGAAHKAFGLAQIRRDNQATLVPLCEPCSADPERSTTIIIRKCLNAPDLKIDDGGKATTEQMQAIVEKQDSTEH